MQLAVNVLGYLGGQHKTDVFALADALANVGGGNLHDGGLGKVDMRVVAQLPAITFDAGIHVEVMVLENRFVIFPAGKAGQVIGSHDEVELLLGEFFRQVSQGVRSITRLWQAKLYVTDAQLIVSSQGQAYHVKALVILKEVIFFLVGIMGGDDKPHLIEIRVFPHVLGNHAMSDVNGIEGPEIKAYARHD